MFLSPWNSTTFYVKILVVLLAINMLVYRLYCNLKRSYVWYGPVMPSDEEPSHDEMPETMAFTRLPTIGNSHVAVYYTAETYQSAAKPWIVVCHGVLVNCETDFNWYTSLCDAYNVLSWDYRGFGRSTGVPDEQVAVYDLLYVLYWLRSQFNVDIRRHLVLLGRSLGSNVVLSFLTHYNADVMPRTVVLCYPFARLSDVFAHIGVPHWLARIGGDMDVRHAITEYLAADADVSARPPRSVHVFGSQHDLITPWRPFLEYIRASAPGSVSVTDVGGLHHHNPPRLAAGICAIAADLGLK